MLNFDAIVKPIGPPASISALAPTKAVMINGKTTEVVPLVRQDLQALKRAPRAIRKYIAAPPKQHHGKRVGKS